MDIPKIAEVVKNLQKGIDEIDFGGVKLPEMKDGAKIMMQVVNGAAKKFGLSLPLPEDGVPGVNKPSFPSSLPSLPKLPTRASPLKLPKILGGGE
jgi:hypothetical protein